MTTAEGIETEEQFELAKAAGCTHAQGYLFGKPVPMSQLTFADEVLPRGVAVELQVSASNMMLVRASFARLAPQQDLASDIFYERLFYAAPQLRSLFSNDMSDQKRKLMATLATGVGKLHDLPSLQSALKALGARHARYGATKEHYSIVTETLLWTLARCLGDEFTADAQRAWTKVLGLISEAMLAGAHETVVSARVA